ncbi:MAG TPA: hypothetical protein PKA37_09450 [Planctomycetota bacterium]|nr:hypothetical protein [Planctomycetota bacterium]
MPISTAWSACSRSSCLLFLVLLLVCGDARCQTFESWLGNERVAESSLEVSGDLAKGTAAFGASSVVAEMAFQADGTLKSYLRTTRQTDDQRLLHELRIDLTPEGDSYTVQERQLLGTRRAAAAFPIYGVVDLAWPVGVIPFLSRHSGGRFFIFSAAEGRVVSAELHLREDQARFLTFAGQGMTYRPTAKNEATLTFGGEPELRVMAKGELPKPTDTGGTRWLFPKDLGEDERRPKVILIPDPLSADVEQERGLLLGLGQQMADQGNYVVHCLPALEPAGFPESLATLRATLPAVVAEKRVDPSRVAVVCLGTAASLVASWQSDPGAAPIRGMIALTPPARPASEAIPTAYAEQARARKLRTEEMERGMALIQEDLKALDEVDRAAVEGRQRLLKDLLHTSPVDIYLKFPGRALFLYGDGDIAVPHYHRSLLSTALAVRGTVRLEFQVLPGTDGAFRRSTGSIAQDLLPGDTAREWSPALPAAVFEFLLRLLGKGEAR